MSMGRKGNTFVATKRELKTVPMKQCVIGGTQIILCRVGKAFYAIDALCTHEQFSLIDGGLEKDIITCPMHGAKFDVTTGAVKALPAVVPLGTYVVETVGEKIFVRRGGGKKRI